MTTSVYVFTGFLDSGKTTALQGSLFRTNEANKGKAIIICTEEGDEEYKTDELSKHGISVVNVEEPEDFTEEFLADIAEEYEPDRVFVEYNGVWNLRAFLDMTLPAGWYVTNVFSLVDASTYEMYLKNMRQTIMEPLKEADVILFNRCDDNFKKGEARRTLKLLNSRAQIFFATMDGSLDDGVEDLLLEDESGSINITDDIFCQWFIDCIENTDKYYGKKVRFSAMVNKGNGLNDSQFYIGRYAAICCEADAQFIGFIAEYDGNIPKEGAWVHIEAEIQKGEIDGKQLIILLSVIEMHETEKPENIYLYF